MALTYSSIASQSSVTILIKGDGVSTDLIVDLTLPPFNVDFKGIFPIGFLMGSTPYPIDVTLLITGKTLLFSSPTPLTSEQINSISLSLLYPGV